MKASTSRITTSPSTSTSVFLNIPYDSRFADLFLAYIAGLTALGLVPRATLEIPGGERRLDRIFALIQECPYSMHDLSRVQFDPKRPHTPRFNMPLELGLAIASQKTTSPHHKWFVFEARPRRIQKSMSDLDGTDVYIHKDRPSVLFSELANAFARSDRKPTVQQMQLVFVGLKKELPRLMREAGTKSCFSARVFEDLQGRRTQAQ